MKLRTINKKRNLHIRTINKLKRLHSEGNHQEFFTFDVLGYSDFCDCYFTGSFQNKNILFNAAFVTLRLQAYNVLDEQVDKLMDEQFPNRYDNHVDWKELGDINNWINGPEQNRYKDWFLQQMFDKEEESIRMSLLEKGIEVKPYIEVLPGYEFGIGLHGSFNCDVFEKSLLLDIIRLVRSYKLTEYLQPIYFGEVQKFFACDIDKIQHSTPLIIKSKR